MTAALVGLLQPEFEEVVTGDAEVREVFSRPAGREGRRLLRPERRTSPRGSRVRFLREGVVIWNGTITSLKRFKDDVREVQAGYECGIGLSDFQDLKAGRRHRDVRAEGDRPHPLVRAQASSGSSRAATVR